MKANVTDRKKFHASRNIKSAENTYGIRSGLILCGMRHDTKDVINVANLCLEAKDKIIGFDIAGPELNFPPSLFDQVSLILGNGGVYLVGALVYRSLGMEEQV